MKDVTKRLLTLMLLFIVSVSPAFLLTGCETDSDMENVAEDVAESVEDAGESVGDAAEDVVD